MRKQIQAGHVFLFVNNRLQLSHLGEMAALMLISDFKSCAAWKFFGRGGATVAWTKKKMTHFQYHEIVSSVSKLC